ncbi:modifier of mdg4 isoform X4 [Chironomus tepperi]|uniref:modifier of mdg4 isoform X4 n=1 Tax=Chironomus tepperi TaxID=113505 RepID=UPI00391FC616
MLSRTFSSSVNMGDQQYVLRWNKHHENLSNGVIKYFKRELMCDVTITVGPGQKLKAHQAILSACSPYFESIFTENTHQNVTVMMVNVDHEILTAIIEYMYKGEVNIAQKLLPDFLKTAAHFQVKGLVDPENIGHNSEYDQHLTSASPPSENNISRHLESRFLNRQLIAERYDNENESDSMNKDYDSINDIENRAELSPNFDDLIRKRRKGSNCDDNSLPQKRLHRTPSESHASSHSSYKISPLPKSNSNDIETSEGKRKSPSDHANILPHQPSIKQEERESDLAVSPQVHLSSNPLNSMYTISRVVVTSDKDNSKVPQNLRQSTNLYDQQIDMTPMISMTTNLSDETEKKLTKFLHEQTKLFYGTTNKVQNIPSTSSMSNTSTTRKTGRFRPNWLEQFKWLKYDEINNTMYCIHCRKWCSDIPDIRTSFVEGNSNFRLEIVNHHDKCKAHKMCHERELKSLQQQQM